MVVAIAVGRPGISALLVASQVALSVVLPFVTLPLILLTSSKTIMRIKKPSVSEKTPQELPAAQRLDALDDEQPSVCFGCFVRIYHMLLKCRDCRRMESRPIRRRLAKWKLWPRSCLQRARTT